MDIGTNMVEKNGLFLERYSVWDTSSADTVKKPNPKHLFFEIDYLGEENVGNNIVIELE